MSVEANEDIIEIAKELAEQWTNTMIGDLLEKAISEGDLEQLYTIISGEDVEYDND